MLLAFMTTHLLKIRFAHTEQWWHPGWWVTLTFFKTGNNHVSLVVGPKRTWDQKLTPGLMLLTFMTMINRTWVAHLAVFHWYWRMTHACCLINWHGLLEKLCVLPNFHEDEVMFRDHSLSPEKQVRNGMATEVREGPKTQDKAERLMVAVVVAFLHEPGAGAA